MANHWILVADAAQAMLFATETRPARARLVETYANPDGHLREGELHTGGSGTVNVGSSRHVTHTEHTQRDHVAELFARRLAAVLREGRVQHRYDDVVLAAPAHFLGVLRRSIDDETAKAVSASIPRDLVHEGQHALLQHLDAMLAG